MRKFWEGFKSDLYVFTKKGVWFTFVTSIFLTALFYHLVLEAPKLNLVLVVELIGLGLFLFFFPIYILGFITFREKWPDLNFRNFYDQIGWYGKKKEPEDPSETEESAAIEETIRIMQENRTENLARQKKSDNK